MAPLLRILLIGDGSTMETKARDLIESSGFRVDACINARDEESALRYLDGNKPHLALMARSMDGKKYVTPAVMKKLRAMSRDTQIVIVAQGHDPEASRIAIDWDAVWIMDLDDGPEICARALRKLDQKRQLRSMEQKNRQYKIFADYIKGESQSLPGIRDAFMEEFRYAEHYQVIRIRVLPKYNRGSKPKEGPTANAGFSVLTARLEKMEAYLVGRDGLDVIICLLGTMADLETGKTQFKHYLRDMKEFSKTVSPVSIWVFMGAVVDKAEDLPLSYASTARLMLNRFFCSNFALAEASAEAFIDAEAMERFSFSDVTKALSNAIEVLDGAYILKLLNQTKHNLQSFSRFSGDDLFSVYRKLTSVLCNAIEAAGIDLEDHGMAYATMIAEYEYFCTIEDVFLFLERNYLDGLALLQQNEKAVDPPAINLAKEYIRAYYNMPLTLHEISEYVHMNENYFSDYFSKHVNMTFKQYQTNLRIKHAKQLLIDKRNSLEYISEEIGYNDVKYFSRAFKRVVGVSPGKYRSNAQHGSK